MQAEIQKKQDNKHLKEAVRVATQYASAPCSWHYLRIYSPGGTCSGMLAI